MLIHGNNLQELPKLLDNSVDAIITDPPYELGFMGKSWDSTGIAYNVELWQQCLRVLKPGGHLLSFSGSRTYHRMAVAIEDAGFQIRDQIMWVYGSGFPKSLDVSKAIDKQAGAQREVVGSREVWGRGAERFADIGEDIPVNGNASIPVTAPATDAAKQWEGWGTALKPAHEPIVLARKPLNGTVANNVLQHGTGALNIDACRVATDDAFGGGAKATSGFVKGYENDGWTPGSSLGRWPANLIHDGSDEVLQLFPDKAGAFAPVKSGHSGKSRGIYGDYAQRGDDGATFYDDSGSAARFFYCAKANKRDRNEGLDNFQPKREADRTTDDGVGGNNPRNRTNTPKLNHHPTVKPTELMRYLCRLITPPGGTILDPFTGSGSTGKAATLEGFNFIGIELDPEYITIAQARIDHAYTQRH
jgi:site-specific DNA-methyltransferase (adenine-specific)